MLPQFALTHAASSSMSLGFPIPSAHAETFEPCIERAGKQYESDRKNGIDEATAGV